MRRDAVLVVDDEPDLQQLLLFNLGETGMAVEAVGTGAGALEAAARLRPRVVVLDVMLPDLSGIEVCRRLRADAALGELGILMLTARDGEFDRVLGLEAGADDYVVKPFSVREVVLRVRALLRRSGEAVPADAEGQKLRWRELEVDRERCSATVRGVPTGLRPLELRLLIAVMEHPGRVFTRRELFERIWGIESGEGNSRTVITHLQRLRERLGDHGDAIETVHGFGYRLRDP